MRYPAVYLTLASVGLLIGCHRAEPTRPALDPIAQATPAAGSTPLDYAAPPDSTIPADPMGAAIRRGRDLFTQTTTLLPRYAPGNIVCSSCHLDAGRRPDAASLAGVYARYPKYMTRTGAVVTLQDRINHCFTRSLAGSRLPDDSREMHDLMAYLAFLSTGVPHGAHVVGESIPKLPPLTGDSTTGAAIYATTCVVCHGAGGAGIPPAIPALWGAPSYSIGASMSREERAAAFIRHFMPQTAPGSLTDQQAYDLAAFINSHERPDMPNKANDWPLGGAPTDLPYDTRDHAARRPPARLLPRSRPTEALVSAAPTLGPTDR